MEYSLPISERKLPISEDVDFENEFFGYDPDQDSSGGIGMELVDRAIYRARIENLSLEEWTRIHKMYYKIRREKEENQ